MPESKSEDADTAPPDSSLVGPGDLTHYHLRPITGKVKTLPKTPPVADDAVSGNSHEAWRDTAQAMLDGETALGSQQGRCAIIRILMSKLPRVAPTTPSPGGRSPAPPELRPIQDFVNTNDLIAGRDALSSPAALSSWLEDHRFTNSGVTDAEYQQAVGVREAVRMFLSRDRGQPSDLEISLLDDVGRRARLQWTFEPDGTVQLRAKSAGVSGALGTILAPLLSAALTGSLARLKTCRNCRWVFYDYSKNRSGTWCSMSLCGSRAKAKRYYRRMREEAIDGGSRSVRSRGHAASQADDTVSSTAP